MTVQVAGGQGLARCRPAGSTRWSASGPPSRWPRAPCSPWRQLTDEPLLGPGQQQIALGLRPPRCRRRELRPGDQVLLVSTPEQRQRQTPPAGTRFDGHRHRHRATAERDSSVVVYLALAVRDVPAVVALAAQDRIAVVLTEAA